MAVERLIGVDFGTSTSVIRVKRYENGNPIGEKLETKEVVFGGNGAMVPTLIMKKDDDASVSYFGYEAQQKKKKFTNFHSFKMDLESSDPAKRNQARLLTEEFYAYLAKQYKSQSDGGHLGNPDDKERTIISYPVKWSEETKNFMLETAKKAGFPNVTGMDEAQAAIQAVIVMSTDHLQKHGLLKNGEGANILLIDMGAGTTDLVLARYVPGDEPKTEVLNTWPKSGDIQFGGREIDDLLKNFFRDLLDEDDAEMVFRKIGADKFKSWKEETVSPALRKHDSVSDFEVLDSCVDMMGIDLDEYCLDRTALENCLADYLKQFPELINGCLQDVGMNGSDVDLVIVTGGHSQWYFVGDMLSGGMPQFGNLDLPKIRENSARIIPITRPQETVALGLAYSQLRFEAAAPEPPKNQLLEEVIGKADSAMEIRLVSQESGRVLVTGAIAKGTIRKGDAVWIYQGKGKTDILATVNRIPFTAVPADKGCGAVMKASSAGEGDTAELLLDGVKEEDVSTGMVLYKDWKCTLPPEPARTPEDEATDFIARYPRETLQKFAGATQETVAKMRLHLQVPDGEQVLLARDGTVFGNGKLGTIITDKRIYVRCDFEPLRKYSWDEFMHCGLQLLEGPGRIVVAGTDNTIGFFLGSVKDAFTFYSALQAHLRLQCGGGEQNAAEQKHRLQGQQEFQEQHVQAEQERQAMLEEAGRRAAAMQTDPKDAPYTPESEFELGSSGGNYVIKKYLGSRSVVSIPPTIRGRKVVEIGACAFGGLTILQGNKKIEVVIIPDTVRSIGARAFMGASSLHTVIAHKGIETIGEAAFYGCSKLQKFDFGMGEREPGHVCFPPGLKKIGGGAFTKVTVFNTDNGIFKEIHLSRRTKVSNPIGGKTFDPKHCAVFYYD